MPVFLPASSSAATTDDLIEATRRHLLSGAPETLNTLAVATSGATSVTLNRTVSNVAPGTLLSVGLESMYVWEVDTATGVCEVLRGYQGSTPAAHAEGSLVRVSPPHSDFAIFRALNAEIDSLTGQGLYAMTALTLTSSETARTYDLTADMLEVYAVTYDEDSDANTWPRVTNWTWVPSASTAEFPSGNMLRLDAAVPSDRDLRVLVKVPLSRLTALGQDAEAVTGLMASALDIPPIGAAWRLTMPSEVERNQTRSQGDSRRAEEVPPGAKLRAGAGLAQMRAVRTREELLNLQRRWPSRSR